MKWRIEDLRTLLSVCDIVPQSVWHTEHIISWSVWRLFGQFFALISRRNRYYKEFCFKIYFAYATCYFKSSFWLNQSFFTGMLKGYAAWLPDFSSLAPATSELPVCKKWQKHNDESVLFNNFNFIQSKLFWLPISCFQKLPWTDTSSWCLYRK